MAAPSNLQIDFTATLPCETLREILHQITFIPHEWDASAASNFPGLFCSWDELQIRAWAELLPLRLAVACVSRRWRAITVQSLYGSFHARRDASQLASFASFLSEYPYHGTLVRRLTIPLVSNSDNQPRVSGILRRCPNLLILSVIGYIYPSDLHRPILSEPSILPTSLKQFDASVATLSVSSIFILLAHLPQLEILLLYDIKGDSPVANYTKAVLPSLRILQLVFSTEDNWSIIRFIRSLELPLLSAMCIGVEYGRLIPTLPTDLSARLEYLNFCLPNSEIDEWEADSFRNLHHLRLDWAPLCSPSFRSHLPMNQIVELTCRFPSLTPERFTEEGVVDQGMNFLLDPFMMPKLQSLILEIGEAAWNRIEKQKSEDIWLICHFEALVASFDQRGVDLWFDRPHLLKENILVRDMICMRKMK